MISVVVSCTSFTINILEQNLTAKSTPPQNEMIITLANVCNRSLLNVESVGIWYANNNSLKQMPARF